MHDSRCRAARVCHEGGAGLSPCARNTIREAISRDTSSSQHAGHAVRRNRTRNAAGTFSGHCQRSRRICEQKCGWPSLSHFAASRATSLQRADNCKFSRFRNATRRASTSHSAPRSLANPTGKSHSELSAGEWDFQIAARKASGRTGGAARSPHWDPRLWRGALAGSHSPARGALRASHSRPSPLPCARHFLWGTFLAVRHISAHFSYFTSKL